MLGYIVMTIVVAAGLGFLIASTPAALTILTIIGGLYLVWLGLNTVRHPATPNSSPGPSTSSSRLSTLLQGMAVSGLNPKGLLIFVAMLPQFTDPAASWPLPVQITALGMTFTATCAVAYLCVGASAQHLLQARPSVSRIISRVSGASMVGIGTVILIERMMAYPTS